MDQKRRILGTENQSDRVTLGYRQKLEFQVVRKTGFPGVVEGRLDAAALYPQQVAAGQCFQYRDPAGGQQSDHRHPYGPTGDRDRAERRGGGQAPG